MVLRCGVHFSETASRQTLLGMRDTGWFCAAKFTLSDREHIFNSPSVNLCSRFGSLVVNRPRLGARYDRQSRHRDICTGATMGAAASGKESPSLTCRHCGAHEPSPSPDRAHVGPLLQPVPRCGRLDIGAGEAGFAATRCQGLGGRLDTTCALILDRDAPPPQSPGPSRW